MVVVIGYQAYDIARSDYGMSIREASLQLGLLGLVQFVPLALLTPVAGWAADRWERRTVARLANSIDMLVALALGWFTFIDGLTLPLLFLFAALHGVARVFVGPSMSAIGPNIVPPASLPRAIALSSIAWQIGSVFGPWAGGLMFAAIPSLPYFASAGLMLMATISLSFVRPVYPPPMEKKIHPIRQMIDGVRYTWSERFLLGAITLDLFAVLLAGATAMLPVYARDILMVGPDGFGQLRAAPAVGASVVALMLTFRPLRHNVGAKMLWAVVIFGIATIGFGLSHEIGARVFNNAQVAFYFPRLGPVELGAGMAVALVMLVVLGASDMLSVYVRSSLVQLNTPDKMRGRVSSVSGLAISASNELGELQSGVAAAVLGPVGAVVFGGVGAIFVTAIWAGLFPELKNARTFEPQYRGKSP